MIEPNPKGNPLKDAIDALNFQWSYPVADKVSALESLELLGQEIARQARIQKTELISYEGVVK